MLVLTRKSGQGIWIGDDIRVVVVEVKDGQVRLGIEAARDKKILRDEIYEKVKAENIKAAGAAPDSMLERLKSLKVK